MPGAGEDKICRDKQTAKETSEDADAPLGWVLLEKGKICPCRSSKCVWLNTQEKSAGKGET